MAHKTINKIITSDGHEILVHIYSPTKEEYHQSKANAVILAVHGLGEYTKRYEHLAEFTCKKNKIFVSYDLRGHGFDTNKKGDVENFSCLILDVLSIFHQLKIFFPQIKNESFAIFGHSLGGMLVTYAASVLLNDVKRIFLSAPGYAAKIKISGWKTYLANNIAQLLPNLNIPIGFGDSQVSNNEVNNHQYNNDPNVIKTVTARFGKILLDMTNENNLKNAMEKITAEVTLILPTEDKIVDSDFTRKMLDHFRTTLFVSEIEGSGHEAFNELKKYQEVAFSHFEKWLEKI